MPLLSGGCLQRMKGMGADAVDNVLLEWAAAIELESRGVLHKIVPLFVDGWREELRASSDALQTEPLEAMETVRVPSRDSDPSNCESL